MPIVDPEFEAMARARAAARSRYGKYLDVKEEAKGMSSRPKHWSADDAAAMFEIVEAYLERDTKVLQAGRRREEMEFMLRVWREWRDKEGWRWLVQ